MKINKKRIPTSVYVKRYNVWTKLKRKIHACEPSAYCKPREVWWVSLGHNVGYEEDGKKDNFDRPVLVLKVFSRYLFLGIPLTSKDHSGDYYYKVEYNGVTSIAILSQVRALSQNRLLNKVGVIPMDMFNDLKKKYICNVLDVDMGEEKLRPQR